jgi:hypothetical protein
MKSIFDQYKSVNEGVLSKSQFLRNVKMSLPKFISNITTFDDAVKILKNKGIITEAKLNEMTLENWTEEVGDEINNYLADGSLTQEEANKAHDYLEDNYYEMGMYNDSIHDPLEAIDYILKKLNIDKVLNISEISRLQEAKSSSIEYGMESDYCNPQEYDLGMRYELGKGTDEEKADKIVKKNLADNVAYYSQLHLAGYNEDAMKVDRKKRTDLPVEVKKDNFVDTANGVKKVKMDKLTEDELAVLVGNILAEVADQKKTIKESLLDNMKAKAKELADLYYDGDKTDERNYLYNYIKNALKKGGLSDADQSELESEFEKMNPKSKPSTTPAGPGSVELYRLGQKGNYTGD